ncbi:MAG: hypothetical protein ABIQ40_12695 [Bacteroidia bacterium]
MNTTKAVVQYRSKQEVIDLIERLKQSGKTKKVFAQENGVKYMTFIDWTNRPGRKSHWKKKKSFIPLAVNNVAGHLFAELHFKNGNRVCFHQPVSAEYFQLL